MNNTKVDQFNLEYQWSLYLQRTGQNEKTMSRIQFGETKRAFYGAISQFLLILRDDISKLKDEEQAVNALENMLTQAHEFWLKETKSN